MTRLSWLHLSDLLIGPKGSRWLWPEYREDFERDLRAMHEQTGPWDLVLLSGDLTDTGSQREFNLLDAALKSFWTYLRTLGSNPLLLAVPGNHDLHQASLPAKTRERLSARRWHENAQERDDFWNEPESAMVMAARTASLASARERSKLWSEPDNALARASRASANSSAVVAPRYSTIALRATGWSAMRGGYHAPSTLGTGLRP